MSNIYYALIMNKQPYAVYVREHIYTYTHILYLIFNPHLILKISVSVSSIFYMKKTYFPLKMYVLLLCI